MKLKENVLVEVEGDSFGEFVESKIRQEKLQKLYALLSNIYKNTHTSIIREYTSNAVDAQKEAGKNDKPVIININQNEIEFIDHGTGISPELAKNVYFNYLDSNKEFSDDLIGAYGIGSKSGLAYSNIIYINTNYNGTRYNYIFSIQENGIPAYELVSSHKTEQENGTKVVIPIKSKDHHLFIESCKTELKYFQNVVVYVNGLTQDNLYKIVYGKHFVYKEGTRNTIHGADMYIGGVRYTIDYDKVNIPNNNLPIGLKFEIGEITPTPSREDVFYTQDAISKINKKWNDAVKEIRGIFDKQMAEIHDIESMLKKYNKGWTSVDLKGIILDINNILTQEQRDAINFPLPDLKIAIDYLINYKFFVYAQNVISYEGIKYTNHSNNYLMNYIYDENKKIIIKDEVASKLKNNYLCDNYPEGTIIIELNKLKLKNLKNNLLKHVPRKDYRKTLNKYFKLVNDFFKDKIIYLSSIKVPEEYIEKQKRITYEPIKAEIERRKEEGIITYHEIQSGYNTDYIWEIQESTEQQFIERIKRQKLVIYGNVKDKNNLRNIYRIFRICHRNSPYLYIIALSTKNQKLIKNFSNTMDYKYLLKVKNKTLSKFLTSFKLNHKIGLDKSIVYEIINNSHLDKINKKSYDRIVGLHKYMGYMDSGSLRYRSVHVDANFAEQMLDVYEKLDGLDNYIIEEAYKLKPTIKTVHWITDSFVKRYSTIDYKYLKSLAELYKYNGIRIGNVWYLKEEYNEFRDTK